MIVITFNEPVQADADDGSHWSLGGADAGALTVSGNTNLNAASGTMNLTLSGNLTGTAPELTLNYTGPDSGGITDAATAANRLGTDTVNVEDGIAPVPKSIRALTSRQLELNMSEPVTGSVTGPNGFVVVSGGVTPAVSSISFSGGTVILELSAPLSGTVSLSYDQNLGDVQDTADNPLASFSDSPADTSSDIAPPAIASANATALNTITVTFDGNVDADATDGSHWSLGGADLSGALTVFREHGPRRRLPVS